MTDDTTAGEVFDWHHADSPQCLEPGLSLRTDGWGCRVCGWIVTDEGGTLPPP